MNKIKNMKRRVAVLSAGLDEVRRGYETHQKLLFEHLNVEEEVSVTLFKRNGRKKYLNEVVLHSPGRNSIIAKIMGAFSESSSFWEKVFFTLYFLFNQKVLNKQFDVIFVIEPGVGRLLNKLSSLLVGKPHIVYTHGISDAPQYYFWFVDEIIEVNPENYKLAIEEKNETKSIDLIPHFISKPTNHPSENEINNFVSNLGLNGKRIILCVGVIQRDIKRVDYVIEEVSKLDESWALLLVGDVIESDLILRGEQVLKGRFSQVSLPYNDMNLAYLSASLMVFASYNEGFGYVTIEAMAFGLPMLLPQKPMYEWILKDSESCIPMKESGDLANKIKTLCNENWLKTKSQANLKLIDEYYSWDAVRVKYLDIIRRR